MLGALNDIMDLDGIPLIPPNRECVGNKEFGGGVRGPGEEASGSGVLGKPVGERGGRVGVILLSPRTVSCSFRGDREREGKWFELIV